MVRQLRRPPDKAYKMALMEPNIKPEIKTLATTKIKVAGRPIRFNPRMVTILGSPSLIPGMGMGKGMRDST